ncbi:hypothetical protein [Streptosporangium sp. OZ121]|uniref:hypothetical protein n=1 Tax=Streptosporangium sp. OZ121 TaxID=3444183 RepID=UPI003F7A382F
MSEPYFSGKTSRAISTVRILLLVASIIWTSCFVNLLIPPPPPLWLWRLLPPVNIFSVLFGAFYGLLAFYCSSGRSWVRIVALTTGGISFFYGLLAWKIATLALSILTVVIIALLLSAEAKKWFSE